MISPPFDHPQEDEVPDLGLLLDVVGRLLQDVRDIDQERADAVRRAVLRLRESIPDGR